MDALTPKDDLPKEDVAASAPEAAPHGSPVRASTQRRYTYGSTDPAFRSEWLSVAREACLGYIARRDWALRLCVLGAVATPIAVLTALHKGKLTPPTTYDRNMLIACTVGAVATFVGMAFYARREIRLEMQKGDHDTRLIEAAATEAFPGGNLAHEDVPSRVRKNVATEIAKRNGVAVDKTYPFPNA
jgi:hypothetical protein